MEQIDYKQALNEAIMYCTDQAHNLYNLSRLARDFFCEENDIRHAVSFAQEAARLSKVARILRGVETRENWVSEDRNSITWDSEDYFAVQSIEDWCNGCAFERNGNCPSFESVGGAPCTPSHRTDNNYIIWVKTR